MLTGKALNFRREPFKTLELADFPKGVIKAGGCHLKFTISLKSNSTEIERMRGQQVRTSAQQQTRDDYI